MALDDCDERLRSVDDGTTCVAHDAALIFVHLRVEIVHDVDTWTIQGELAVLAARTSHAAVVHGEELQNTAAVATEGHREAGQDVAGGHAPCSWRPFDLVGTLQHVLLADEVVLLEGAVRSVVGHVDVLGHL